MSDKISKHIILLERADKTAAQIIKCLAPYCKKKPDGQHYIEVAGSVRRRRPWVHDIDIVLIAEDHWNIRGEILRMGLVHTSGPKLWRQKIADISVDYYFTNLEYWATIMLIRTGSTQNNIRLCTRANELGWMLHAGGEGLYDQDGKRIAGDTEESIYNALGLPYQLPEERE